MTSWERAQTALALLAVDPTGLGGITVKARVGPARDAFLSEAKKMSPDQVKLHPTMTSDALDGSIDITATLERGKIIHHDGLLARTDRSFILSMAERADPYLAARLAMSLDAGELRGLIALDEGVDDDEHLPANLADRLAFQVSLDDLSMADISVTKPGRQSGNPNTIEIPGDLPEQLVILAVRLGIHSLRAPSFALRAAKAHAVLLGRNRVCSEDITAAVELVFAHRATQLPQQDDPTPPEPEQPDSPPPDQGQQDNISIPDEMLLEAVLSALPDGFARQVETLQKSKSGKGAGSGKKIIGNRRGRPLPTTWTGIARSDARVDLMATLRAAIPWQTIRKASQPDRVGPIIRPSDLRSKRYQELSDRVLVFAVDASGSAALARLGEAKGAIELLLGEAYSRRDPRRPNRVSWNRGRHSTPSNAVACSNKTPTGVPPGWRWHAFGLGTSRSHDPFGERSETWSKRPTIVILTDGRSNIALDGTPNRKIAAEDAVAMGHQIRASGFDTIVIDTGNRPEQSLKSLADAMAGHYITLPRADAKHLSETISTTLKA